MPGSRTSLQEIIIKHEFLRETLRTWRARMQGEPTAPQPEPEPRKSEAGPAAPPPQVKRVAWSSSAPAALPTTTGSAYWEQVREQEAAWEDEMSGLLKIVKEEQPQDLRDPMRAVFACRDLRPHRTWSSCYVVGSQLRPPWSGWRGRPTGSTTCLKQSPAPHRSLIDSRSVTERDILWAVATIRRDGGQKADAAQILQCVIQNEIEPIAGLLEELRTCNSCLCKHYHHPDFPDPDPTRACRSNFSETIQRTVELHELVRVRLSNSRVRMLSKSGTQPEPEPLQPEAPKAGGVPIRPT